MKLYHRTTAQNATAIVANGFRDRTGHYLTDKKWSGVWLSDRPLDCNEGLSLEAGVLLEVDVGLPENELTDYEWIEADKTYREWLIPAAVLNANMTVREIPEDDQFEELPPG